MARIKPEKHAEILRLAAEGYDHLDIAVLAGVDEQTVRIRLDPEFRKRKNRSSRASYYRKVGMEGEMGEERKERQLDCHQLILPIMQELDRRGTPHKDVTKALGFKRSNLHDYRYRRSPMQLDNLIKFAEMFGFELVLRRKEP